MTDESFMAKAVKASTEAEEAKDLGDKVKSKSLEVGMVPHFFPPLPRREFEGTTMNPADHHTSTHHTSKRKHHNVMYKGKRIADSCVYSTVVCDPIVSPRKSRRQVFAFKTTNNYWAPGPHQAGVCGGAERPNSQRTRGEAGGHQGEAVAGAVDPAHLRQEGSQRRQEVGGQDLLMI
jgi:hypothetical protein